MLMCFIVFSCVACAIQCGVYGCWSIVCVCIKCDLCVWLCIRTLLCVCVWCVFPSDPYNSSTMHCFKLLDVSIQQDTWCWHAYNNANGATTIDTDKPTQSCDTRGNFICPTPAQNLFSSKKSWRCCDCDDETLSCCGTQPCAFMKAKHSTEMLRV